MDIDITPLKSGYKDSVEIDMNYEFREEELERMDLLGMENFSIAGSIENIHDTYHLEVEVKGTMILPCAITLEPVPYPFSLTISENLEEEDESSQKKYKNNEKSIDILPIIWENILMEIPMKVVSPKASDVHLEGDGWKLITEEEENTNSPFDALDELLK